MICAKCLSMFSSPIEDVFSNRGEYRPHHQTEDHLKLAASGGCKLCEQTYRQWCGHKTRHSKEIEIGDMTFFYKVAEVSAGMFQSFDSIVVFFRQSSSDGRKVFSAGPHKFVRMGSPPFEKEDREHIVECSRLEPTDAPWTTRQIGALRGHKKSSGHPNVANRAALWLKECLDDHTECAQFRDVSWHPKRLIDVRDPRKPRLIITALEGVHGQYATLSHCWGENPDFLMLSSNNEEALRQLIPLKKLPKTFHDAIFTTKRLDIPYLWIDSLCIAQSGPGSDADWKEHVTVMRLIYQNCLVNIAADHGSNHHKGMFLQRSPSSLESCHVSVRGTVWTTMLSDQQHGGFRNAPLTRRAWVFQERVLSPRVIHFGSQQIYWECSRILFASESMPKGYRRDSHVRDVSANLDEPSKPFSVPLEKPGKNNSFHAFASVYSRMRLSYVDKDIFAAFAGVAEKFGNLYNHDYVAGHFRPNLPMDLMWKCDERPHTSLYRAPTWSWISVSNDGTRPSVYWPGYGLDSAVASVVSVHAELVDESNRYGPIKSAEITLRGALFDCFHLGLHPIVRRWRGLNDSMTVSCQSVPSGAFTSFPISKATKEALSENTTGSDVYKFEDVHGVYKKYKLPSIGPKIGRSDWAIAGSVVEAVRPVPPDMPREHPSLMPHLDVDADNWQELMDFGHALVLPIVEDGWITGGAKGIILLPASERPGCFKRVGMFQTNDFPVGDLIKGGYQVQDITII